MREQMLETLFYVVFLGQVLVLSFALPRLVLSRARLVVAKYPPSTHPKLYSTPIDATERALRVYRNLNHCVLAAGLALVAMGIFFMPGERLRAWQEVTDFAGYPMLLTGYLFAQIAPLLIVAAWGFPYFGLKRRPDSRTTRRAELRRRRLTDFVPPTLIAAAAAVYVAFVAFIVYIGQFDFPWFGGYLNVVIVTGANLFFLAVAARQVYGKRKDPYQAYEDRTRQLELSLRTMLLFIIGATVYAALGIGLQAAGLDAITPIATSLYYQLLGLMSFREFSIDLDRVNFEVYREDPVAA